MLRPKIADAPSVELSGNGRQDHAGKVIACSVVGRDGEIFGQGEEVGAPWVRAIEFRHEPEPRSRGTSDRLCQAESLR